MAGSTQGFSAGALTGTLTLNTKGFAKGIRESISDSRKMRKAFLESTNKMARANTLLTKAILTGNKKRLANARKLRAGRQRELAEMKESFTFMTKGFAATATAAGVAGVATAASATLIGKSIVQTASDAQETINLFEVALGTTGTYLADAKAEVLSLSEAYGLSRFKLMKYMGTFNIMLKSLGASRGAALEMSKALTMLTNDLASLYNLGQKEAFTKIQAGLAGEVEPLRRIGIIISETTAKTYALRTGLIEANQELTEGQKIAVRYKLIMEQTAEAQGDWARTIDNFANQQRIFNNQIEQTSVEVGKFLIGPATSLMQVLSNMAAGLAKVTQKFPTFIKWATLGASGLMAIAGAAGTFVIGLAAVQKALVALNLTMVGPFIVGLGIAAAAVVALGVAFVGLVALRESYITDTKREVRTYYDLTRRLTILKDAYDRLAEARDQKGMSKKALSIAQIYKDAGFAIPEMDDVSPEKFAAKTIERHRKMIEALNKPIFAQGIIPELNKSNTALQPGATFSPLEVQESSDWMEQSFSWLDSTIKKFTGATASVALLKKGIIDLGKVIESTKVDELEEMFKLNPEQLRKNLSKFGITFSSVLQSMANTMTVGISRAKELKLTLMDVFRMRKVRIGLRGKEDPASLLGFTPTATLQATLKLYQDIGKSARFTGREHALWLEKIRAIKAELKPNRERLLEKAGITPASARTQTFKDLLYAGGAAGEKGEKAQVFAGLEDFYRELGFENEKLLAKVRGALNAAGLAADYKTQLSDALYVVNDKKNELLEGANKREVARIEKRKHLQLEADRKVMEARNAQRADDMERDRNLWTTTQLAAENVTDNMTSLQTKMNEMMTSNLTGWTSAYNQFFEGLIFQNQSIGKSLKALVYNLRDTVIRSFFQQVSAGLAESTFSWMFGTQSQRSTGISPFVEGARGGVNAGKSALGNLPWTWKNEKELEAWDTRNSSKEGSVSVNVYNESGIPVDATSTSFYNDALDQRIVNITLNTLANSYGARGILGEFGIG